jgi:hypothetical protein
MKYAMFLGVRENAYLYILGIWDVYDWCAGYVLTRPKPVLDAQLSKEAVEPEPEKAKSAPEQAPALVVAAAVAAPEAAPPPPKVTVSEEEQRQVLQWVLEEKRKVKAQNKAEKASVDEEKRVLKQYLRASHLPPLV